MAAQPLPEPQPMAVLRKERQTPVRRQLLFRPLDLESQLRLSFHPLSPPALKGFTSQVRIHSPDTSMPRGLSCFFSPSISVLGIQFSSEGCDVPGVRDRTRGNTGGVKSDEELRRSGREIKHRRPPTHPVEPRRRGNRIASGWNAISVS